MDWIILNYIGPTERRNCRTAKMITDKKKERKRKRKNEVKLKETKQIEEKLKKKR